MRLDASDETRHSTETNLVVVTIGLLRGGSTPLCAVSHPDVNCTSDSRRRGREGRLYLGAVAVDGQATAGKMSINRHRDLARAAAGP